MLWYIHSQPVEYPLRGMTPFRHRGDDQIRAAYRIAPGEDLRVGCLIAVAALDRGHDPPPVIRFDTLRLQPRHRVRIKAKRHDDCIRGHHKLAARHRNGPTTPLRIRLTERGTQHPDTVDLTVRIQRQLNRLDVKLK